MTILDEISRALSRKTTKKKASKKKASKKKASKRTPGASTRKRAAKVRAASHEALTMAKAMMLAQQANDMEEKAAKKRSKKSTTKRKTRRTPAQVAATKRMLAANKKARAKKAGAAPKGAARKDPRRVAAGKKAAATRAERDELASHEIPSELHDIWDRVRWQMPIQGRKRAEVFLEWAHDNPDQIRAMRSRSERVREKALERFQTHCARVAERARESLASQDWDSFATLEPLIEDQLEECEAETSDPRYNPKKLEQILREEAYGAPF